jgi:hypothetical protein
LNPIELYVVCTRDRYPYDSPFDPTNSVISECEPPVLPGYSKYEYIHLSIGIGVCAIDRDSDISTLRNECETAGGYLSVLQAPEDLKRSIDVWGYRGNAVTLMRAIEQQFDPDNMLNPDRCFYRSG